MDQNENLRMIEKIRGFRVNKKRKKVAIIENSIIRLEQDIGELNEKIHLTQKSFREEKKEILEELVQKRSNIDAIYTLQKKELLQQRKVREAQAKRVEMEEDVVLKKHTHQLELKDLWASEKALIKIEEFVKMELR